MWVGHVGYTLTGVISSLEHSKSRREMWLSPKWHVKPRLLQCLSEGPTEGLDA